MKNGTSAPMRAAMERDTSGGGCVPVRAQRPFSVAAASELPPPSPASAGIPFRMPDPDPRGKSRPFPEKGCRLVAAVGPVGGDARGVAFHDDPLRDLLDGHLVVKGYRRHDRADIVIPVGAPAEHLEGQVQLGGGEKGDRRAGIHRAPLETLSFSVFSMWHPTAVNGRGRKKRCGGASRRPRPAAGRLPFHLDVRQLLVILHQAAVIPLPEAVDLERLHHLHDGRGQRERNPDFM